MRLSLVSVLSIVPCAVAQGPAAYEGAPIDYGRPTPEDPVARLQRAIESGDRELAFDPRHGFLPALLDALDVPWSSQALVFSKTSFQNRLISPDNPRAVYFGDDIYVGSVPGAQLIELSAVDAEQGAVFYTLGRSAEGRPQFQHRTKECLSCHALGWTKGWPGHLVRSIFPDSNGHPITRLGTSVTTHATPFTKRWGGWYVSGTHGAQRHMGNVAVPAAQRDTAIPDDALDRERGANVTDLSTLIDTAKYLTPHSDIAALMVLEHHTEMHNVMARASYRTRVALYQQRATNLATDAPPDEIGEATQRRIRELASEILDHLLFRDEARLDEPVRGTSTFAADFAARGPHDPDGRSLRELDLETRLFRYPCSHLVYSAAFDALPQPLLDIVHLRLFRVLSGRFSRRAYRHLSAEDRRAILEILVATKPELPEYFRSGVEPGVTRRGG